MRLIVTDVAWSVCLLLTTVCPATTAEPIEVPFWCGPAIYSLLFASGSNDTVSQFVSRCSGHLVSTTVHRMISVLCRKRNREKVSGPSLIFVWNKEPCIGVARILHLKGQTGCGRKTSGLN